MKVSASIDTTAAAALAANRARRYSIGSTAPVQTLLAASVIAEASTKATKNGQPRSENIKTNTSEPQSMAKHLTSGGTSTTTNATITTNASSSWTSSDKAPDVTLIRTQRFAIIGDSKTTSKLAPLDLLRKMETILKEQRIMVCLGHSPWIFQCRFHAEANVINSTAPREPVLMEIEICKAWLLNVYGVRMKRVSGNALAYKQVYERICKALDDA